MSVAQLLILHKEHGLNMEEISLILEMPLWEIRQMLRGRLKPKKPKRSWRRSQFRISQRK